MMDRAHAVHEMRRIIEQCKEITGDKPNEFLTMMFEEAVIEVYMARHETQMEASRVLKVNRGSFGRRIVKIRKFKRGEI